MDSALSAGGRGPFRGQDAPCARLDYFIRVGWVWAICAASRAKARFYFRPNGALKGSSSAAS